MNKKFEALINKLAVILSKRSDRLNVIDKFDKCLDELAGADYTAKADYVKLAALLKSQGSYIPPKKENEKEQEELKVATENLESKVIEIIQGLSGKIDNLEDKVSEKEGYTIDPNTSEHEDGDEPKEDEKQNQTPTDDETSESTDDETINKIQESSENISDDLRETSEALSEKLDAVQEATENISDGLRQTAEILAEKLDSVKESSENISDDLRETSEALSEKLDAVQEATENISDENIDGENVDLVDPEAPEDVDPEDVDKGIASREDPEAPKDSDKETVTLTDPENKPTDKGQDKASEKVVGAIKTNTKENIKSSNKYSKALGAIKGLVTSIGKSVSKNIPAVLLGIFLIARLVQKAFEAVRDSVVGFAKDVWDATPEWIRKPIRFIYNGVKLTVGILQDIWADRKLRKYLEEHGGIDKMIADKQAAFELERQENWDNALEEYHRASQAIEEARASGASADVLDALETEAYDALHRVHDAEVEYEASHADAVIAVQEELKEETGTIYKWAAYDPEKFKGYREWYRNRNEGKFRTELAKASEDLNNAANPTDWWEVTSTGTSEAALGLEYLLDEQDISEDEFYDTLDGSFSNDQIRQMWDSKSRGNTELARELLWNFLERNEEHGIPEDDTDRNGVVGIPSYTTPEMPSQVSPFQSVDGEVQEFNNSQGQQVVSSSNNVTAYYINNVKNDNYNLYG